MSPVRMGVLKPSIIASNFNGTSVSDILETLEQYFNGEQDFTALLAADSDLAGMQKESLSRKVF